MDNLMVALPEWRPHVAACLVCRGRCVERGLQKRVHDAVAFLGSNSLWGRRAPLTLTAVGRPRTLMHPMFDSRYCSIDHYILS